MESDMDLVVELREALGVAEEQAAKADTEVQRLRMAIAAMTGEPIPTPSASKSREFEDLGVTQAAKRFIREKGEPQDTRTIADALLNRGLKTNSKNFIATVYATLNNGKLFNRTDDSRWALDE
jgi:hypothetical protein